MLFSAFSVLSFLISSASARHAIHPSSSITIPFHTHRRDTAEKNNTASTLAGITPVSLAADRQTYWVLIRLGNIAFRAALDTASSDLFIVGSNCAAASCVAVPRYPLSYGSPTFGVVNDNQTLFKASYADETMVSGFVARESVQVANLTLPDQVFALVTDSNVTLQDDVSGILGLGFPRLSGIPNSVANATSFFPTLAQKGILDYPLFGVSLTHGEGGSLSFGAIDTTIVKNVSQIGWNPVVEFSPKGTESNTSSYLHWVIPMSSFSVNGTKTAPIPTYPGVAGDSSLALFDIGTSGIYGPYQDVERLFAQIPDSRLVNDGIWAIPCDTIVPMAFTFGQRTYTLEPTDYLLGPASGNPNLCLSWPMALPPSADNIDWQFGGPFLRTVYSVFSYGINAKEAPHIGFYPLNNGSETEDAASIAAYFASVSATIPTTLPNSLLPTPSFSTPSYAFNSSIPASTGGIVTSALAISTYSAIFGKKTTVNVTSLPGVTPEPTVTVITTTNEQSDVTIITSSLPVAAVTLGIPPGWNAASGLGFPPMIPVTFIALVVAGLTL